MKRENKKTGLTVLVIILSILVVCLSSYIIYDKIVNNEKVLGNCLSVNDENNNNDSDNAKDNVVETKVINYKDLISDKYKNYDGSYGTIKKDFVSMMVGEETFRYYVGLSLDNEVLIDNWSNDEEYILNVENVIDVVVITDAPYNIYKIFMLTEDGSVYSYNLSDLLVGKYDVNKINISNKVIHIFKYSYFSKLYSSGSTIAFAYTVDNKLIEIKMN